MITPLHIEIMLHYNCCEENFPRLNAPACQEYAKQLAVEGLLEEGVGSVYRVTSKGKAWVCYLCMVPFPIQQWVLPISRD